MVCDCGLLISEVGGSLVIQFQETHLLQMVKKRGKKIITKEKIAEDWCFECKDGGDLMICDYGKCPKAYHRDCVEKDDLDLTSDGTWICGWHRCLECKEPSKYRCYCCKRAACSGCIGRIDFVHLKGNYGFCNNCLKLALLVEEDKNIDSDGESVDLRDWETYEGLFREYYEIVKEKEGFDTKRLFAGKAQLDNEKLYHINSNSDKRSEEEDEHLSSENGDYSEGEPPKKKHKKKRCTQRRTNSLLVARKTEEKAEKKRISSIWCSMAPQRLYAALIPENMKLVYLKKRLVEEMIQQPESIETKIVGSFVRVRLDPRDPGKHETHHQLAQITGINHGSSDKCNNESSIQVSNMARDVCLTMLSNGEITKEECDELKEKVKAGLLKKLTVEELEQKAKILHEDITKHEIARELQLLPHLIDHANEKGWRQQVCQHVERRTKLLKPSYLSDSLLKIPAVIPEDAELESLGRNDNQTDQAADETTSMSRKSPE